MPLASRAPYVMMYEAPARRRLYQLSSSAASKSTNFFAREQHERGVFAAHLVGAARAGRSAP